MKEVIKTKENTIASNACVHFGAYLAVRYDGGKHILTCGGYGGPFNWIWIGDTYMETKETFHSLIDALNSKIDEGDRVYKFDTPRQLMEYLKKGE